MKWNWYHNGLVAICLAALGWLTFGWFSTKDLAQEYLIADVNGQGVAYVLLEGKWEEFVRWHVSSGAMGHCRIAVKFSKEFARQSGTSEMSCAISSGNENETISDHCVLSRLDGRVERTGPLNRRRVLAILSAETLGAASFPLAWSKDYGRPGAFRSANLVSSRSGLGGTLWKAWQLTNGGRLEYCEAEGGSYCNQGVVSVFSKGKGYAKAAPKGDSN